MYPVLFSSLGITVSVVSLVFQTMIYEMHFEHRAVEKHGGYSPSALWVSAPSQVPPVPGQRSSPPPPQLPPIQIGRGTRSARSTVAHSGHSFSTLTLDARKNAFMNMVRFTSRFSAHGRVRAQQQVLHDTGGQQGRGGTRCPAPLFLQETFFCKKTSFFRKQFCSQRKQCFSSEIFLKKKKNNI